MDPLSELFRKYGSDKGGDHLKAGDTCHRYGEVYHELFKDRRDQVGRVLEIGIAHGHSLRAWRDYFPNAEIVGIDINPACIFQEERIACYETDQRNASDLLNAMARIGRWEVGQVMSGDALHMFDLIVDDGSHEPAHQIFSARLLLPFLSRDGLHVIEDIEPDCKPELIGKPVVADMPNFMWMSLHAGHGLGRAHCQCGCDEGENLVAFKRRKGEQHGAQV